MTTNSSQSHIINYAQTRSRETQENIDSQNESPNHGNWHMKRKEDNTRALEQRIKRLTKSLDEQIK